MTLLDRLPLRHRNDPSVHVDLDWTRHGVDLPAGLELTWLGTAGFRLTYEGTTVLIDPYLSRASLRDTAARRPLHSDPVLVDRLLPAADAVLLGHTHFDHAVDVAHLVRTHGCRVYGSTSAAALVGAAGRADLAVVVEPHHTYDIGPFTVSFTPSLHSKLLLGLKVPSDGELTCDSLDDMGAPAFRCGEVYGIAIEVAGITLYHQGSANLVEEEIRVRGVDVFLCGIAGRIYTPRFTERILRSLDPKLVVVHHHDDFFRPAEAEMGFSFNVNLGGFVDDVARVAPGLPVRTLQPLLPIG